MHDTTHLDGSTLNIITVPEKKTQEQQVILAKRSQIDRVEIISHTTPYVSQPQGYMKKEKLRARDFSLKLDKSANEIQFQG